MFFDGLYAHGAALGFANHGNQPCLSQHHFGKAVHTRSGGGACRAYYFIAHGVYRAHVVDDAVGKVHRQLFAFGQHVGNAFVGGIAPRKHFAVKQQRVAWLPGGYFGFGKGV